MTPRRAMSPPEVGDPAAMRSDVEERCATLMRLSPRDPADRRPALTIATRPCRTRRSGRDSRPPGRDFRGVSSEIDYLNGEIVLLGRLHDVLVQFNAAI